MKEPTRLSIFLLILFTVQIHCIEFSKDQSLHYLFYQKAAYCPRNNITEWECGNISKFHQNMQDIKVYFNDTHAAQGYIGYDKNQIVIAFRGSTRTLTNWLYNFDIAKSNFEECQKCSLHTGFLKTYLDIKSQLITQLEEILLKYPEVPIIITGHSLGGAIATIAAVDIQLYLNEKSLSNKIKEVHTFGSPRVGNKEFVDFYNELIPQTVRVVHNKDIVPHIPPNFLGFYHVGTEVWLDAKSDTFVICNSLTEDKSCSSSIVQPSVTDHVTYLNNNTGCKNPNSQIICQNQSLREDCDDQDVEVAELKASLNKSKLLSMTNKNFEN